VFSLPLEVIDHQNNSRRKPTCLTWFKKCSRRHFFAGLVVIAAQAQSPKPFAGDVLVAAASQDDILAEALKQQIQPQFKHGQTVAYQTPMAIGSIIINTKQNILYFVLGSGRAVTYRLATAKKSFEGPGARAGLAPAYPDAPALP
jgi:lipoprotein-anchoring transpeptidase ErfK/SrfK